VSTKKWWKSKTMWLSVATLVLGGAQVLAETMVEPLTLIVIGVAIAVLRVVTTTALTVKDVSE